MVEVPHAELLGPGMRARLSSKAMRRGDRPEANDSNILHTTSAWVVFIRRAPVCGLPSAVVSRTTS